MEWFALSELWSLIQIVAIDALMAGDNAVVVGTAAAAVPAKDRKQVIVLGTLAAVVMRILLSLVAVQLLKVIGLTLAGGLLLGYVAYSMYQELRGGCENESHTAVKANGNGTTILRAVGTIAMADLSMSLDNVLAVAGAANGHLGIMVIGLLVSVTLMAMAASAIAKIIEKNRWVAWLGLIMVVYVAMSMIFHGGVEVVAAASAMMK